MLFHGDKCLEIREGNRKADKDAEKAARLERIPSEAAPDSPPEGGG